MVVNIKGGDVSTGKEVMPYTWCVDESDGRGTMRWHCMQFPEPRPLYVPATLLSDGGRLPVVVVEGEKCAEAGHQLLGHEFDFVSWPGGANASRGTSKATSAADASADTTPPPVTDVSLISRTSSSMPASAAARRIPSTIPK